jgi:hypothetical protein
MPHPRRWLAASLIAFAFLAFAAIPLAPRDALYEGPPQEYAGRGPRLPPPAVARSEHTSRLGAAPEFDVPAEAPAEVSADVPLDVPLDVPVELDALAQPHASPAGTTRSNEPLPTLEVEFHDLRLEGPGGIAVLLDRSSDDSVTLPGLELDGQAFPIVARRIDAGRYDTLHAVLTLRSTGLDGASVPVYCAGASDSLASAQECAFEWQLDEAGVPLRIEDGTLPLWLRLDMPRHVGPDGSSLVVAPRVALSTHAP